jgi:hypothetical protein
MITCVSRVPRAVPLPRCLTDQQWRTSWAVHSNGSGFDAVQPSTCDPVLLVARRPIAPSLPECESFHTSTLAWLLTGVMVADESPFPAATYSHDPGWVLVRRRSRSSASRALGTSCTWHPPPHSSPCPIKLSIRAPRPRSGDLRRTAQGGRRNYPGHADLARLHRHQLRRHRDQPGRATATQAKPRPVRHAPISDRRGHRLRHPAARHHRRQRDHRPFHTATMTSPQLPMIMCWVSQGALEHG